MLLHVILLCSFCRLSSSRRNSTRVGFQEALWHFGSGGWHIRNRSDRNIHRSTNVSQDHQVRQGSEDNNYDEDGNGQQQSANVTRAVSKRNSTIGAPNLTNLSVGLVALFAFSVVCMGLITRCTPIESHVEQAPIVATRDVPMALTILRSTGESLAIVDANGLWYGEQLLKEVSAHLAPEEHLHSIMYQDKEGERRISDFCRLGAIGLEDGAKIRVITLSSCALPSGISFFSFKKRMASTHGAHKVANLWVHTDNAAWLEYGEVLDVDCVRLKYLQGSVDEKESLRLQDTDREIESIIEESHGKKRVGLQLTILGEVQLEQILPDAVFDISQLPGFVGWISIFEGGEMVAKFVKVQPETQSSSDQSVHLRFQVCRIALPDGNVNITFSNEIDFQSWTDTAQGKYVCSKDSAMMIGPVGKRKLKLTDFPIIGSVELIEQPFCSDMLR